MATSARLLREAAFATPAAPEKHGAACDKRDAGDIHDDFVDAEVHAFVEDWVSGLAAQSVGEDVLDGDERGADEEDEEAAEKQNVGEARESATPDAALEDHIAKESANGHLPVDAGALSATLSPKLNTAHDAVEPSADRCGSENVKRGLGPARNVAEDLSGQDRGSFGREGLSPRHGRHNSAISR